MDAEAKRATLHARSVAAALLTGEWPHELWGKRVAQLHAEGCHQGDQCRCGRYDQAETERRRLAYNARMRKWTERNRERRREQWRRAKRRTNREG